MRIVVVVEGGVVQNVLSDEPAEVAVVDYDTEGADEEEIICFPNKNAYMGHDEGCAYIADTDYDVKEVARIWKAIEEDDKNV